MTFLGLPQEASTYVGNKTITGNLTVTGRIIYGSVVLTDGATPALDASLGNEFYLASVQNPTIAIPTNPVESQVIRIIFKATSAPRTLSLNTGTNGFAFGTDIPALSATGSGLTDVIICIYHQQIIAKWLVVGYVKGFS